MQKIKNFFKKYEKKCHDFNGDPVHIPRLDPKNGIPGGNILVMFINERPGRIGPGVSNLISFDNCDPTARRFRRLFKILNMERKRIVITNACIYYSKCDTYRDTPPNAQEILFSAKILEDQIKRIHPKLIVPLGNVALYTLRKIYPLSALLRKYRLARNVGDLINDTSIPLFPVYHTSNRAAVTRTDTAQQKDWRKLGAMTRVLERGL